MIGRSGKGLHSEPDPAGIVKDHEEKKGRGRMYGEVRVLATEALLDTDDRTPRAIVWCVYGNYPRRCASQRLRDASKSQGLLAELDRPVQLPCTFDQMTRHLAPGLQLDISDDVPNVDDPDILRSEAPLFKWPRTWRFAQEAARETDPLVDACLDRAPLLAIGEDPASSTETPCVSAPAHDAAEGLLLPGHREQHGGSSSSAALPERAKSRSPRGRESIISVPEEVDRFERRVSERRSRCGYSTLRNPQVASAFRVVEASL